MANSILGQLGLGAFEDEEQRNAWLRSALRSHATLLGGPVDLANAAIGGLNYLGGGRSPIRASEKPVMGSQWIAEKTGAPIDPGSPYADLLVGMLGPSILGAGARGAGRVLDRIEDAAPTAPAGSPGAQAGAISLEQAKAIIDRTRLKGGATMNVADSTMPKKGYAVADIGPEIGLAARDALPPKKQVQIPISEFNSTTLRKAIQQNPLLDNAKAIGTWVDDGKVYVDASQVINPPFAARLETKRRKQLANYNLRKQETDYGSIDARERITMRDAAAKNEALTNDVPLQVPPGDEFWPWRVKHGGFKSSYNEKDDKFFVQKIMSPDELKLQKAMQSADKSLLGERYYETPRNQEIWDMSQLKRPSQLGIELPYDTRPTGYPKWIADQYGKGYEKKMKDAALTVGKSNPEAWKFYWTGQLQDDFHRMYGPQAGQDALHQLMSNVGSTTSGSRPSANSRMGSYYDARQAQGLPLPSSAPFPYGHNKAGTHLQSLEDLRDNGGMWIDPGPHPKPATFTGNLTGYTPDATIDEVMTSAGGLTNQQGKALQAPQPGTYHLPVKAFRNVTRDLARTKDKIPPEVQKGLIPSDVQSVDWAHFGGDPSYAKAMLRHFSDRINVTSEVTGLPRGVVKDLWMRKKIPLLTTGGLLGLGLGSNDEEGFQ